MTCNELATSSHFIIQQCTVPERTIDLLRRIILQYMSDRLIAYILINIAQYGAGPETLLSDCLQCRLCPSDWQCLSDFSLLCTYPQWTV